MYLVVQMIRLELELEDPPLLMLLFRMLLRIELEGNMKNDIRIKTFLIALEIIFLFWGSEVPRKEHKYYRM